MTRAHKEVARAPMEAYVLLLEKERQFRRMFVGLPGNRLTEVVDARKAGFALLSPDGRVAAMFQTWLASPASFDAYDTERDLLGTPSSERHRKFWWDIPQFPRASWEVDVDWGDIERHIGRWEKDRALDVSPDYQREHVWTVEQRRLYVEYQLQGGELGTKLIFNHTDWDGLGDGGSFTLVDGKQRLEAVRSFLRDEFPAFGRTFSQWSGSLRLTQGRFKFQVVCLKTKAELLQLYLRINAGGTPHSAAELSRVRAMLAKENGG